MTVSAAHIRETLDSYVSVYPHDADLLGAAYDLLDQGADLSNRREFRGHATAGALLVDERERVLLVHHRALGRWLFPGGHLESSDISLHAAALRELAEETGVVTRDLAGLSLQPVHIDIHPIPANPEKGEPDHRHIDFRFAFRGSGDVRALQWEEVTDSAWKSIPDLEPTLRDRLVGLLAQSR